MREVLTENQYYKTGGFRWGLWEVLREVLREVLQAQPFLKYLIISVLEKRREVLAKKEKIDDFRDFVS